MQFLVVPPKVFQQKADMLRRFLRAARHVGLPFARDQNAPNDFDTFACESTRRLHAGKLLVGNGMPFHRVLFRGFNNRVAANAEPINSLYSVLVSDQGRACAALRRKLPQAVAPWACAL